MLTVHDQPGVLGEVLVKDARGVVVASLPKVQGVLAHTFAAAPDLLAFAKHALARLQHGPDANPNDGLLSDALDVIARAEGRSVACYRAEGTDAVSYYANPFGISQGPDTVPVNARRPDCPGAAVAHFTMRRTVYVSYGRVCADELVERWLVGEEALGLQYALSVDGRPC